VTSSQYVGYGAPAGQSFVTDPQYMVFWGTSELAINDQPLVRGLAYYSFLTVSTEVYVGTACVRTLGSIFVVMFFQCRFEFGPFQDCLYFCWEFFPDFSSSAWEAIFHGVYFSFDKLDIVGLM
jgi:hypothetical protein